LARRDGNRLVLEGAVTVETVPALLEEGRAQLRDGVDVVDFGAVTAVDSAAVALAVAWLREARAAGRGLAFANPPPALRNLARLYAVDDLIPFAAAAHAAAQGR
jgi:phospholipid transport system transporter-binding protein